MLKLYLAESGSDLVRTQREVASRAATSLVTLVEARAALARRRRASEIPPNDYHHAVAEASRAAYQEALTAAGLGAITTEIADAPEFYYAEDYHQQYLAKNPWGYCGLGGTGVGCPRPPETMPESAPSRQR